MTGAETARETARGFGFAPFGLVLVLVAAPNLVFLATHLASAWLAALCLAATLAALAHVLRDLARTRAPLDGRLLGASLAAGLGLCLLGGETHLVFANDDWLIRDAVLHDLVAAPWPVGYRYGGDETLLRAPLGLYLVPALAGKLLGLRAAHAALLGQNALLFGCLFYGFAGIVRPFRRSLAVLAIFILFSGWDVVGTWIAGKPLAFGTHLENWVSALQFSSHVTQIFWVPNHAASGWVFVGAYLLWQRDGLRAPSLIAVFGLCVFWSPLSMMGALPFLIRALLARRAAGLRALPPLMAAALAGLGLAPVALYLQADAGRVAHGLQTFDAGFLLRYALFIGLELGPALVVLRLARTGPPRSEPTPLRTDTTLVVGLLLVVPLYRLGAIDFVMRASIPALAVLALRTAAAGVALTGSRRAIALAIVAIGAVTPLYEIGRSLTRPAFAISDCDLLAAARTPPNDGPLFHYLARRAALEGPLAGRVLAVPDAFSGSTPRGSCWPDRDGTGDR